MGTIASPVTAVLPGIRQQSEVSVPRLRELTAALARGDDAAWAEFHRDYGPEIFRYVLGGTRGDYDLAAEALQQTYLRWPGMRAPATTGGNSPAGCARSPARRSTIAGGAGGASGAGLSPPTAAAKPRQRPLS